MCGIVAKVSKNNSFYFLRAGLKSLEYSGYDSSGIAGIENSGITIRKKKENVAILENQVSTFQVSVNDGIGHIKSSTYGKPGDNNTRVSIAEKVQSILNNADELKYIAIKIKNKNHSNAIYLGRGISFSEAFEGSLKLKELFCMHLKSYPEANIKHRIVAFTDEDMSVKIIGHNERASEKIISNFQEVKAGKGKVIAILPLNKKIISKLANHSIFIPATEDQMSPLLQAITLSSLTKKV